MNKFGRSVLITALVVCCVVAAVLAPMAVFGHIDNLTMDQDLPIEAIVSEIEIAGDDMPLVANMHKILSDIADQELAREASDTVSMRTDMEQFLKSEVLPADIAEGFAQLNVSGKNQRDEVLRDSREKTYGFYFVGSRQSVKECQYTVEKETGKIIYLYAILSSSENATIDGTEGSFDRKRAMENYITYLDLDLLGDWVYNGNRYHSEKAGFYVSVEYLPERRYYSIGLEG